MTAASKKTILIGVVIGFIIITLLGIYIAPMVKPTLRETMAAWEAAKESQLRFCIVPATKKVLAVLWLIYAVCGMCYATSRKTTRAGEEHGSAKWGNAKDICKRICDKDFFKNRILSLNIRLSIIGRSVLSSLNTLVIGGMGAGKSFFLLIPNLLQGNTSFVATDPSGELVERTGWFLKNVKGYKVKVVDLEDINKSIYYNFFKYIKNEDDIISIVDMIFDATAEKKTNSNQDPMWDNMAKDRLIAYIAILWQRGQPEEQNIDTLIWLKEHDTIAEDGNGNRMETAVSALFKDEAVRLPGNMASSRYISSTEGADETVLGVTSTLNGRIGRFLIPSVRRMMSSDELELEKIGNEKTALFLVIPSEKKSFNFIMSMIYTQAFEVLYGQAKAAHDKKLKVPVQFYIDEMFNTVLPHNFTTYLTTGRKHGISFIMFNQEMGQLEQKFPQKEFETLIGTSNSFVYLGGSGKNTHEYISKWIGNQTITTTSQTVSYGMRGGGSKNMQATGRPLIAADEIDTKLGDRQCLVKIKGLPWVIDSKNDPRKHPNYKYCADMNGNYYDWSGRETIGTVINPTDYVPNAAKKISLNLDEVSFLKLADKYDINWEEN